MSSFRDAVLFTELYIVVHRHWDNESERAPYLPVAIELAIFSCIEVDRSSFAGVGGCEPIVNCDDTWRDLAGLAEIYIRLYFHK